MSAVQRKNISEVIPAVIAAILGGSTLISFIISAFLTPNVIIDFAKGENLSEAQFIIRNTGNAPAKDVVLTIQAPCCAITIESVFSTENYSERITPDPNSVELDVPRFVQGGGSIIKIDTIIDNESKLTGGEYNTYITYDQGSVSRTIPILPERAIEVFSDFWVQYGTTIGILIAFIAFVPVWIFIRRCLRKVEIKGVVPKTLRGHESFLTIYGRHFGVDRGTAWIEYYEHDSLIERYRLDPVLWSNKRIDVRLNVIGLLDNKVYVIRVERNGVLTIPNSNAEVTIRKNT